MGFTLFLMALTTIYLVAAFQIRVPFAEGLAGPRFLPILASVIMYLALLRIIWRQSRQDGDTEPLRSLAAPAQVVGATGLYAALFEPLGYVVSTFLFTLALFRVFDFERNRPLVMVLYAAAVTLVFYLLFAVAFSIRLPLVPGAIQ